MIFIVLALAAIIPLYKRICEKKPHLKKRHQILISAAVPLLSALIVGAAVTELYYTSLLPELQYVEIDRHPTTDIDIEQYVAQEPIVLMDRDHNLHYIDLNKAEITFSSNSSAAFIKTEKAKGIWKLIVLDQSRTSYSIQFCDYWLRKW